MSTRNEHLKKISSFGGIARVSVHGNPGTEEGRRRGGLRSARLNALQDSNFKRLRKVAIPCRSPELAELIGILMGDGHVGEYQVSMTTHSETDREHLRFVKNLFEVLFPNIPIRIRPRNKKKAIELVASSKDLGRVLVKFGMVKGNKLEGDLHMPGWVKKTKIFQRAWVRGLFDTDGSVFLDTHQYKGKTYRNIGIAFSSRSSGLLQGFNSVLESYGLRTTQTSKSAVFLRRKEDIRRYFEVIGTSNPKHRQKAEQYLFI